MSKETKTKRFQAFHALHQSMFSFNFSRFKLTFVTSTKKQVSRCKPDFSDKFVAKTSFQSHTFDQNNVKL